MDLKSIKSRSETKSQMETRSQTDNKSIALSLDLVRPLNREMILRSELAKKKDELEMERWQKREAVRCIEEKYDGYTEYTKQQAQDYITNLHQLKCCYQEARAEIKHLQTIINQQNEHISDYKNKFMKAQQQVEEHKKQLDNVDMQNERMSEQINLEILNIKEKFREKLQNLEPLPEKLKKAEMFIKQTKEEKALAEHRANILTKSLNVARERIHVLLHNMIQPQENKGSDLYNQTTIAFLQQKISFLNNCSNKSKLEIERLKTRLFQMEDEVLRHEKRWLEKVEECRNVGGELDMSRLKATKALTVMNQRFEISKKSLEMKINDLEFKLKAANAEIAKSEIEKESIEQSFQAMLKTANESYEIAQLQIMELKTQLMNLRWQMSTMGGDGDNESEEPKHCVCGTLEDPPSKPVKIHSKKILKK